jgi:hypothetical protein
MQRPPPSRETTEKIMGPTEIKPCSEAIGNRSSGMALIQNLPWIVNRVLLPDTVVFVNRYGRVIETARLSNLDRIPHGAHKAVLGPS